MSSVLGVKCDLCGVVREEYGLGRLWQTFTWIRWNDPLEPGTKHACDNCWWILRTAFRCSVDVVRHPLLEIDRLKGENETLRNLCERLNAEIKAAKRDA
jgi:hypothetical protein